MTKKADNKPVSYQKLISMEEMMERFNRSYFTIRRWYKIKKILPKPIEIEGMVLGWDPQEVEDWLQAAKERRYKTYG